jgi:hypothetical protein
MFLDVDSLHGTSSLSLHLLLEVSLLLLIQTAHLCQPVSTVLRHHVHLAKNCNVFFTFTVPMIVAQTQPQDVIKFGQSTREYVLLHDELGPKGG